MQPTYSDAYGWTVPCSDCCDGRQWFHTTSYMGGDCACDTCGGRGFHELTDEEAEELLAPSAPISPEYHARAEAALQATLAKIDSAFGRAAA